MLGYSGPKMSIAQGNAVNAVQTRAPNGTTKGRSANAVRMKQWKLIGSTNAVMAKFIALLAADAETPLICAAMAATQFHPEG